MMLSVRLKPELNNVLESRAKKIGRTKSSVAREAICQYLEDREDYELGVAAARDATAHISLDELIDKYGLRDEIEQQSEIH
jgi:RHH-type transcriptional regulator, rel operon repressor / antitoxin RelB